MCLVLLHIWAWDSRNEPLDGHAFLYSVTKKKDPEIFPVHGCVNGKRHQLQISKDPLPPEGQFLLTLAQLYLECGTTFEIVCFPCKQAVSSPCRGCPPGPCQTSWSVCNASCVSNSPQIMNVHLPGLDLTEFSTNVSGQLVCTSRTECDYDQNSLYASQPTFFVTVRATNGAGLTTTAISNGVKVDQTPPTLVRQPEHFDVAFSLNEAIRYQSSNSTIYASWKFVDLESDIVEYEWAIGTSSRGTDLQDFTSVGLQTEAANRGLAGRLQHNGEYYVTVRARNGAGLFSEASSEGVVLITTSINRTQAQASVQPLFTMAAVQPVNVTIVPYTQAENAEHAGITWEGINADVVCKYYRTCTCDRLLYLVSLIILQWNSMTI